MHLHGRAKAIYILIVNSYRLEMYRFLGKLFLKADSHARRPLLNRSQLFLILCESLGKNHYGFPPGKNLMYLLKGIGITAHISKAIPKSVNGDLIGPAEKGAKPGMKYITSHQKIQGAR